MAVLVPGLCVLFMVALALWVEAMTGSDKINPLSNLRWSDLE